MNKLRELRKANNLLDKKLSKENNETSTNIICYLRSSDIYEEQIEEIRQDILYMLLDAQEKGEDIHSRLQENLLVFCDEIIENTPKKTKLEKFLEFMNIIFLELIILSFIVFVCEIGFREIIQTKQFPTQIHVSLLSVMGYLMILIIPHLIYRYVTKNSLKTNQRSNRVRNSLLSGLVCGAGGILLYVAFTSTYFIISTPLLVFLLIIDIFAYLFSNLAISYLHKKHIQMTNIALH